MLCLYCLLIIPFVVCESNILLPTSSTLPPASVSLLKFISSLSSVHDYEIKKLSSALSSLSYAANKYENIITTEDCASFFRGMIPYLEDRFMTPKNYDEHFCQENPYFCKEMKYFLNIGGKEELDRVLRESGIYLKNRKTCEFEMIPDESNREPKEQAVTEDDGLSTKTTKFSYQPNKCERYTYFLYTLMNSPRIKNHELLVLKEVAEEYMETHNMAYPLLVQRILYAAFRANQQKHDAILNRENEEIFKREQDVLQLCKCLQLFDDGACLRETTLWTSPAYQLAKELTTRSSQTVTEGETFKNFLKGISLKVHQILSNDNKSTSPTKF